MSRCFNSRLFLLILIIISLGNHVPIYSQESDTIPIPLYIDETYFGEIAVTINSDDSVHIRPAELIAYLEELMSDESIETAKTIFPEAGWLNLPEMAGLGVRIVFSFDDLTMKIYIPAHLRRETVVSFEGHQQIIPGKYIEKTNFSAFTNLSYWNKFDYEDLNYHFSFSPELGMNIYDWVIEAEGGIHSGSELLFLDYARVIKDFPSLGYRLEIGDLTIPVKDLSSVSKLTGASFTKNYELVSSDKNNAAYEKELFLREPSKVEVYLNDRKVRENDFKAGSYIFKNFPLTRGINRISIRWEDSDGPQEETLVIPFEDSMLSAGEIDLGVALGLPDRQIALPSFTSYQYLGITEIFTFGLVESFNIETLDLRLRPDFMLSTNFGNFSLVPVWGMNFSDGSRQFIDAALDYQLLRPGIEKYLNFGAGISYIYNSINTPDTPQSQLELSAYYNLFFGSGFSLTPDAYWSYRFNESRSVFNIRTILKKNIRGGSSLSANISLNYDEEFSFAATISYSTSFPELNQNLYILEDLDAQTLSAFWSRYSSDENDFTLNTSAKLPIEMDEELSVGLSGGYKHPLFSVDGGHAFRTIINDGSFGNSTTLSASTAFAFAEGHFLMTNSITDSFVIVAPGEEFSEQTLKINPTAGGSEIELTGAPGILSNVNSFSTKKVWVEPEDLPLGMDSTSMRYLVKPSYKSAFVVTPQAEVRAFIGAIIIDSNNNPVEATLGSLTGKLSGESVDFFTDDTGYFEAYGLRQDEYVLKLNNIEQTIEIDLSNAEGGFFDAGTINLTE